MYEVVGGAWHGTLGRSLLDRLVACSVNLSAWSKKCFGSFRLEIKKLYQELDGFRLCTSEEAVRRSASGGRLLEATC